MRDSNAEIRKKVGGETALGNHGSHFILKVTEATHSLIVKNSARFLSILL